MKIPTLIAIAAAFGLVACSSVPGAVHDAGSTASAGVNGTVSLATTALDGTSNLLSNLGNDVTTALRSVMPPVPPSHFP